MKFIEQEGRTIEEATTKALEALGVPEEKVDIEIVDEGQKGLLGIVGVKMAKIKATLKADENFPKNALTQIMAFMRMDAEITSCAKDDGGVCLSVKSQDAGILIGQKGATLDSLEFLLNRIYSKATKSPQRIEVDIEGYRQRRKHSLEELARRLAHKAKETQRPAETDVLNPRERLIVHLALKGDKDVSTSSQGTTTERKVVISPRARRVTEPADDSTP